MCAWQAAARGLKVLVVERSKHPGRKIIMSGGGRCNFTNLEVEPSNYLCNNPHFVKSALKQYLNWDFIGSVIEHGISYHERDLGKLFCDDSAKDILNMLLTECEQAGVELLTQCDISEVSWQQDSGYTLQTNKGKLRSPKLVIATGGLSIPKLKGGEFGYQVAEQFGLNIVPMRAGLVPFIFSDEAGKIFEDLSGTALDVTLSNQRASFSEAVLFTHRGLSGPAALQLSNYWHSGEQIMMDLLPSLEAADYLLEQKNSQAKSLLRTVLREHLPKALISHLEANWWPQEADKPMAEINNQRLKDIGQQLNNWALKPAGTEGYRTAEVTLGGVDCAQISSKTMAAKDQPGLYFIGEVLDVTGHLGGFNFQWAWSSGYACAQDL